MRSGAFPNVGLTAPSFVFFVVLIPLPYLAMPCQTITRLSLRRRK